MQIMETVFSHSLKVRLVKKLLLPTALFLFIAFTACNPGNKAADKSSDSLSDSVAAAEDNRYHADNDIAMTIKSVADALNQGEELDSLDYNFEGILTDGTGRPLYTDIQGTPGVWSIRVEAPNTLVVKNLYLGDLLPESLENYIVQSLGLEEESIVDTSKFKNKEIENSLVYAFDGGFLIFNTTTALTPAGQEGPLLTIIATSNSLEED